jgi:hypothetical protein
MMSTFKHWIIVPATLAMLLTSASVARSQPIQLAPGFNPLQVAGTSGGSQSNKGCGMVGAKPNHVINLSANFRYLRFRVQSSGQPTLLIEGPNGRSCVQADTLSEGTKTIEIPGYWEQGNYSVYVGDRAGGQHTYTLSVTETRN